MLKKDRENKREQIDFHSIDDLMPEDHLLRKIDKAIDFSFIYDLVSDCYCPDNGRPSIDPVVLFKIVFIQYLFGISSMRKTIREIKVNIAYRWFLGYGLRDSIPHFTTFGKNYVRRFSDTDVFERIFSRILEEGIKCGYVSAESVFIDSTHIKANANRNKKMKEEVEIKAKEYHSELMDEVNRDREANGKKAFKEKDDNDSDETLPPPTKTITGSRTDPESGMFHKGEHERCFAYGAHTACDKNNFILGVEITPGNIHDSVVFSSLFKKTVEDFPEVKNIVVDAGYKTPYICKTILDHKRTPVMPYKRVPVRKGMFRSREFRYDKEGDFFTCPAGNILKYGTTNRDGYREYKSNRKICRNCPYLEKCTHSKNCQKVMTRHVWASFVDKADFIRLTPYGKKLYAKRSQTIERVFADAKEKHGLRYTTLRGKAKVRMKVLLTFACMNLKKIATWKAKDLRYKGQEPFFQFLFPPLVHITA